jgi:hypothetical protein
MTTSFTPLQLTRGIAHGDLRLVCLYTAMETHFMKLPTNSSLTTEFQTPPRHSRSVSLCGLSLCGWVAVAPRHFYFTIKALTVDRAALARQKFDELTCWKGGTLLHVESHCQWRLAVWLCARFYIPVKNGWGWNSRIHSFEGVSTDLSIYSVPMVHS